jgi:hypothetical protein
MAPAVEKRKRERGGASIIEVTLMTGILVATILPAMGSFLSSMNAQQSLRTRDLLEDKVRRTMERVVFHLRPAGLNTLDYIPDVPQSSQFVRFKKAVQFDVNTGPLWGYEMMMQFVNGELSLCQGSYKRVLGKGLTNATFSLDGRTIRIKLRADGVGPHGESISVVREGKVTLQN